MSLGKPPGRRNGLTLYVVQDLSISQEFSSEGLGQVSGPHKNKAGAGGAEMAACRALKHEDLR